MPDRWKNLPEQEKWEKFEELYYMTEEYRAITQDQMKRIEELKTFKKKVDKEFRLGFTFNATIGVGIDSMQRRIPNSGSILRPDFTMGMDILVLFYNHFLFSPGLDINIYDEYGMDLKIGFGWLF